MEINCLTLKDLISSRHGKRDFIDEDGESAQKENIFDRPRMTPKTPMKNEPIDLSKQKTCTPERSPITPVKLTDRPLADPWTPTANLKMLISAASPDMRDREKKKELFRPIENNEFNDAFPDSLQCGTVDDATVDEYEKQRPSRKQKSLGLLCQKFLARYPSYPLSAEKTTISLDEVASSLGVERRRIYDIVNVLESLDLVSRVAKNQYCWHGRHSLSQTLRNLQEIGELQKYEELMASFQHKELDLYCKFGEHKKETFLDFQDRQLLDFSETDFPSASANSRKDKSLRIMSQKFVMLFLVSKTKIVTLDIAAKILIEESQDTADHSKFKTKVRRLYDIANVLTSLELIEKVHVTEERGRKPAFKWIGPVEFTGDNGGIKMEIPTCAALTKAKGAAPVPNQACASRKERLSRHASFGTAQPSEVARRKASSEPSSPRRGKQDDCCSKMINLASVCCQKMEDDASLHESLSRGSPPEKENWDLKGQASPCPSEGAESLVKCQKRSSQWRVPPTEEEPTAKRQSLEQSDGPISLVVSKKNAKPTDAESSSDRNCSPNDQCEAGVPAAIEAAKSLETWEQEKPLRNKCSKENAKENEQVSQENGKQSFLPQYLYVQHAAGLNGFNFLFPASQAPGPVNLPSSRLPSLNVPCMMVPSTALAPFPLIYSPAVTSQLSSAPAGSFPNVTCVNFSMPGLAPTTPVFIGTPAAVVAPNSSQLPALEPHQQIQPAVHLSPVLGSACSSVKADSPVCMGHPVTLLKFQQSSAAPLTPKNMRSTPQEVFFKTPGSLEDPVAWRKSEGNQSRTASSVQRRLEISSNSSD
nr:transcription factor E2F7 isoform X2 [Zootoca vivipara]